MNMPGYIKLKSVVEKDGVMYGEPAEEYAPVARAYWKWAGDILYWVCSVCEGEGFNNYQFCPHCGAKMDESEGNDNE